VAKTSGATYPGDPQGTYNFSFGFEN